MAAVTSGEINTSDYQGRYVKLSWYISRQYIDGFSKRIKSEIHYTLTGAGTATSTWYNAGPFYVRPSAGDTGYYYRNTNRIQLYDGTVIGEGDLTVTHDENDVGTLTLYVEAAIYSSSINCTGQGTFDLTVDTLRGAIAYAPTGTVTVGANNNIKITVRNSNYTHTVKYQFGDLEGTILENSKDTSYTWLVPQSFYAQMPNSQTKIGFLITYTYNGSTLIAQRSSEFTAQVAASYNLPTIGSPTCVDTNPITIALTGNSNRFIRYHSNCSYSAQITAKNSATVARVVVGNGTMRRDVRPTGGVSQYTISGVFEGVETAKTAFDAYDSRGLLNTTSVTSPNFVEYTRPTCYMDIEDMQANNRISFRIYGKFFNQSFGAVTNSITLRWGISSNKGETYTYTTVTPTISSDGSYSIATYAPDVEYTTAYTLIAEVTDELETVTTEPQTVTAGTIFDWSKEDFNFNVPVTMKEGLSVTGSSSFTGDVDFSNSTVTGLPIPTRGTWSPTVNFATTGYYGYGDYVLMGDMCIISFYITGTATADSSTVRIAGLPFKPYGYQWQSGGGTVTGYALSRDSVFMGWQVGLSGGVGYIYGRTGGLNYASSTTTNETAGYIQVLEDSSFMYSGTIMYKIAQ